MRVLFSSPGAAGHLFPMVPTAQALRAAGHPVLFAGSPPLELFHRTGLPAVEVGDGSTLFDAMVQVRPAGVQYYAGALPRDAQVEAATRGFAAHSRSTLDGLAAVAASWEPDVLVHAAARH